MLPNSDTTSYHMLCKQDMNIKTSIKSEYMKHALYQQNKISNSIANTCFTCLLEFPLLPDLLKLTYLTYLLHHCMYCMCFVCLHDCISLICIVLFYYFLTLNYLLVHLLLLVNLFMYTNTPTYNPTNNHKTNRQPE